MVDLRHSSSSFMLLLFLLTFLLTSVDAVNYELKIRPKGVGPDSDYYIVAAGSRLEFSCELEVNGHAGVADHLEGLDWMMNGSILIGPYGLSMFTRPKLDEKERMPRQELVIPSVNEKLAGEYRCVYFDEVERPINVHIADKINWRLKNDKPGGPIGQPLTVDCGAEGVDNSAIKIMDQHGHAIEESNVTGIGKTSYLAGSEFTIPKLGTEHQNLKIRCVAIQTLMLDEEKAISTIYTNERELTINVWQPPQFVELANGGHFYAVPGSTVVLRWTIRSSNPPGLKLTLKKNNELISNTTGAINQRYTLNSEANMMSLKISEVLEEDYGRYTCIAYNGKLAGEQSVLLDIPKPPKQPRVWLENVTNRSISWHMEEERDEGQLPVSYFWITYKPIRRRIQQNVSTVWTLDDEGSDLLEIQRHDHNIDGKDNKKDNNNLGGWELLPQNASNTNRLRRRKNPANVYDIAGLDSFTEYLFTFVAGNPTGESDPLERKQETMEHWSPAEAAGHAEPASSSALSGKIVGSLILLLFLLGCLVCFCVTCHDVDE